MNFPTSALRPIHTQIMASERPSVATQDVSGRDGRYVALDVRLLPINVCPVDATSFVLPSTSATATLPRFWFLAISCPPLLHFGQVMCFFLDNPWPSRSGNAAAGWGPPIPAGSAAADEDQDGADASGLTLLAHALVSLTAQLGQRPDVWCLGPTSRVVGEVLWSNLSTWTLRFMPGSPLHADVLCVQARRSAACRCRWAPTGSRRPTRPRWCWWIGGSTPSRRRCTASTLSTASLARYSLGNKAALQQLPASQGASLGGVLTFFHLSATCLAMHGCC